MTRPAIISLSILALGLGACGDTTGERSVSGGAIGAGVGVAGAAIVGGSLVTGAIAGAAIGAVTGAVTDKDDIDLGD